MMNPGMCFDVWVLKPAMGTDGELELTRKCVFTSFDEATARAVHQAVAVICGDSPDWEAQFKARPRYQPETNDERLDC